MERPVLAARRAKRTFAKCVILATGQPSVPVMVEGHNPLTDIVHRKRPPMTMAVSVCVLPWLCSRLEGVTCAVRHDRTNGGGRGKGAGDEGLVRHGTIRKIGPRRFPQHRVRSHFPRPN